MSNLLVVYLLRKDENYEQNLDSFLSSLNNYGIINSCMLLFLFKGFKCDEVDAIIKVKNLFKYSHMVIDDHLFDLNSYIECANQYENKYFLFLNSYSILNCGNWLNIYLQAMCGHDSVFIGSSASCEGLGYNPPLLNRINFFGIIEWLGRSLMRRIYSIRFMFSGAVFPNPHIRTNAFLIDRVSFLEYFQLNGYPRSKFQCYLVESGLNSLTKFMIKKSSNVAIVSNKGEVFNVSYWSSANLFRSKFSEDRLIVTDNRTREYDAASIERKARLTWDSWRV